MDDENIAGGCDMKNFMFKAKDKPKDGVSYSNCLLYGPACAALSSKS